MDVMEAAEASVGEVFDAAYAAGDLEAVDTALGRLRDLTRQRLELLKWYGYGIDGYSPSRDVRRTSHTPNRPLTRETTPTA